MQRFLWFTGISVLFSGLAVAQVKKQFTVEDNTRCEIIKLQVKTNKGNCFIRPSHNPEILSVFSNQEPGSYSHNFSKEVNGKACEVSLSLEEAGSKGFSQTISSKVFSSDVSTTDKFWKMYLMDEKPYELELSYGLGAANIDLSGLAIKNLKINTASADVIVGYHTGIENQIEMDTLTIKVDLGSVSTKSIALAKTRNIIADVGLGNVTLDFSGDLIVANHVKGSVGAGNLVVLLPMDDSTPVSVKIKDSWLCSIKMPPSMKKTGANVYENEAYQANPKDALIFDLNVSVGNVIFKQVSR